MGGNNYSVINGFGMALVESDMKHVLIIRLETLALALERGVTVLT